MSHSIISCFCYFLGNFWRKNIPVFGHTVGKADLQTRERCFQLIQILFVFGAYFEILFCRLKLRSFEREIMGGSLDRHVPDLSVHRVRCSVHVFRWVNEWASVPSLLCCSICKSSPSFARPETSVAWWQPGRRGPILKHVQLDSVQVLGRQNCGYQELMSLTN